MVYKIYYVAESLYLFINLLNSKQTGYVTHNVNFNVYNISGFLIVREKSFPRSGYRKGEWERSNLSSGQSDYR